MKNRYYLLSFLMAALFYWPVSSQVNLQIANELTNAAGQACVPVSVENFSNVIAFQFSISWNDAGLQFEEVTNFGLPALVQSSFNTQNTGIGFLTVAWDDPQLIGQSLPDQAVIFEVCFIADGNPGDVFEVNFSEIPTPSLIVQLEGSDIIESVPGKADGSVTIANPLMIVSQNITDASCFGGDDGGIVVEIEGGNPPYMYSWDPPLLNSNTVESLTAGTYSLTIIDSSGDTLAAIFEVGQPQTAISANTQLPNLTCPQPLGAVEVLASGGTAPYGFTLNGEFSSSGVFENVGAGIYDLITTDNNGCQLMSSITIEAPVIPEISIEGDSISCGEPVNLTVNEDNGDFEWFLDGMSLGINQSSFEAIDPGLYEVIFTNEDLCTDTAFFQTQFAALFEVSIDASDFEACPGDTVTLIPSGGQIYTWSGVGLQLNNDETAFFNAVEAGIYIFEVIATDALNCHTDSASIEILVTEPLGYAAEDTCIALGDDVRLEAFNGENYLWMENEYGISNSTSASPASTPDSSTVYIVQIEDANSCFSTDSIAVTVIDNPIKYLKAINVITPNGDGENDFLAFENLEKFTNNRLVVFNRWGTEVYNALGYNNNWNGTYMDKPLPTGTYYYILTVKELQLKSALTILND